MCWAISAAVQEEMLSNSTVNSELAGASRMLLLPEEMQTV